MKDFFNIENLLASSLTKLVWLALAAWVISKVAKEKTTGIFWAGYSVACVVILAVITTKTNPVNGDKTFNEDTDGDGIGGTLNDYATGAAKRDGYSFKKPLEW